MQRGVPPRRGGSTPGDHLSAGSGLMDVDTEPTHRRQPSAAHVFDACARTIGIPAGDRTRVAVVAHDLAGRRRGGQVEQRVVGSNLRRCGRRPRRAAHALPRRRRARAGSDDLDGRKLLLNDIGRQETLSPVRFTIDIATPRGAWEPVARLDIGRACAPGNVVCEARRCRQEHSGRVGVHVPVVWRAPQSSGSE